MHPLFLVGRRDQPHHRFGRRIGVALLAGLTLLAAACGTTTSGGGGVVPTPTPTATATVTPTPAFYTSWRLIPSPNVSPYRSNQLNAATALSPSAAWAVGGSTTDGIAEQSLIEQWDGTAWKVVPSSDKISFSSIVALSANDMWAVGYNRTPRQEGFKDQFEHWNGLQWTIVPSPNATAEQNFVLGLAAISTSEVWAVGQIYSASVNVLPFSERWDGTSWKFVTTPTMPGATESLFRAVAQVPGTNQLLAVGYTLKGPRPAYEQPFIERWDGAAWQIMPSPALPGGALGGYFYGVTALSPTDAWAVGDYTASNHTLRTLIAHWDGTSWTVVSSPDTWGTLTSVAAAGPHNVRAVGHSFAGDGNDQHALIEQWNGTSWQVVKSPEPSGATYSALMSITTDGAGGYWATGSSSDAEGIEQTLMVHCP